MQLVEYCHKHFSLLPRQLVGQMLEIDIEICQYGQWGNPYATNTLRPY